MDRDAWDLHWSDTWRTDGKWKLYGVIAAEVMRRRDNHGATLLDAGCGVGAFLDRLKIAGGLVAIGVDWSETAVDLCGMRRILAHVDNADTLGTIDGRFDFITAIDLLDCVDDPTAVVSSLASHLADGGALIAACSEDEHGYEQQHKIGADRLSEILSGAGLKTEEVKTVKTAEMSHSIVIGVT